MDTTTKRTRYKRNFRKPPKPTAAVKAMFNPRPRGKGEPPPPLEGPAKITFYPLPGLRGDGSEECPARAAHIDAIMARRRS